ncbi:SDR family oxidoreductase [Litorimonas sp.]|uniref:SDR family oxidoreductase n=1 Tax=Litorimonas sp. TaxID=1892381 RepID=UPI003A8B5C38
MNIDVTGKRVIVTGASRGIGNAIATAYAKDGAKVAICARTESAIQKAGDKLLKDGAQDVIALPVDVSDTEQVRSFVKTVAEKWGGVDVLVNNAGQGRVGSLETLQPEDILDHANNLQVAHFRFVQACAPYMREQKWGRIININALNGVQIPGAGFTTVSNRAAGIALSKSLGQALAKDGILVNTLNMGWIDTGQWERHFKEMPDTISREEFYEMVTKPVPLGRLGQPEEVANIALFLGSDLASFVSAASIDVAGGMQGQIAYYPTLKKELVEEGKRRQAEQGEINLHI